MSGFGIRAFKKLKEDNKHKEKSIYSKHLVYGNNASALIAFHLLNKKYPGDVKIITRNALGVDDLKRELSHAPSSIRSKAAADKIMSVTSRFEVLPKASEVQFYKDAKFHKFGGRAKPHELFEGEAFFCSPEFSVNWLGLFSEDDLVSLSTSLKENQLNKIISEIAQTDPEDLVEVSHYKLVSGEFENISCEKLYFCDSPKVFYSLIKDKEKLSEALHGFCAPLINQKGFVVNFKANKEVYNIAGTVFVPQSATHEWGSFICEFDKPDAGDNSQEFRVLTFLGESDITEEELAKKIKHLRRVVERVFPEIGKAKIDQDIRYNPEFCIAGQRDELSAALESENVSFLGAGAAIKLDEHEKSEDYAYHARAVLSLSRLM